MKFNKETPIYKLTALGLRDLTVAIVIGTILFFPLYLFNEIYTTVKIECKVSQLPENDQALKNWYENNGIKEVEIERDKNALIINYKKKFPEIFNSPKWDFPDALQFEELGYREARVLKLSEGFTPSFNIPAFIVPVIMCSQIGFLLVGLWRIRKLKRDNETGAFAGLRFNLPGKILFGFIAGICLVSFGLLYDLIGKYFFGFQPEILDIWKEAKNFSNEIKFLVIILGVIVAPICEEIFFRGAVLRSFAQNEFLVFGVIFSSVMFAAIHFDFASFPAYFIFGVVLALTSWKTNSLVPAIIAHAINNAIAFYLLYAW